jgi:hypothetical protein
MPSRFISRALWLKEGDKKTNFFHEYVNLWKIIDTIWKIKDDEGIILSYFEDKSKVGSKYF